ncbi:DNA polymerase-3 subunit epsilon [Pseudomonas pohangensis]|uniref:DNA polymerase-3 subunit epsilon n=1 Tax=Pseudomonas pohangensis TaxID=364197 RepID=A0A1H2FEB0_9PSED|nr:3'-5' exonuclease [Pseudomonas pohangensis]SDU05726.1 DNA polymerase-3 subunit epsilon [Pseudomonas pohangensis]
MEPIAVIDFETTGMSPGQNCRATEIAAVIVQDGRIVARYQSLMNSGAWVPPFIENLTGISNAMLRSAPSSTQVMGEVADFVGSLPLVAHNAAFDQKFWDSELALIQRARRQNFACSMLLARRLLPQAPNHKLGTLNSWAGLPHTGKAHRAMADTEMAANLTLYLSRLLREQHGIREVSHDFLCTLQKVPAAKIMQALSAARGY